MAGSDPTRGVAGGGVRARRETSLTVFGWIWIALGAIRIVSIPLRGMMTSMNRSVPGAKEMIEKMEGLQAELPSTLSTIWGAAQNPILNLLVGGGIVFTAVAFLRLEPWSRLGLELFAWLGLANAILGAVVTMYFMDSMVEVFARQGQAVPPPGFDQIVRGSAVFGAFTSLIVPAGLVFLMRSRFVREPFARATASPHPAGP